jgi:hypothetical protein
MLSNSLIEIFSSEMSISSSSDDFENTVIDGEEGYIESTTTEIEDNNVLLTRLLVHTVSNSSGSRLVDNTEDFHSRDSSGILGSLSLGIVEVSGDSDDGVFNFLTEVSLSDFLHLDKDHGRDLFGREGLHANSGHLDVNVRLSTLGNNLVGEPLEISLDFLIVKLTSNKSLNDIDGSLDVVRGLVLGSFSNKTLLISEGDVRGSDSVSELILDDLNSSVLENTNARVSSSEIDTNDGAIDFVIFLLIVGLDCGGADKGGNEEL